MRNGSSTTPAVDPLTRDQRQRVECMTFVRALWTQTGQYGHGEKPPDHEILRLTEYLYNGNSDPKEHS